MSYLVLARVKPMSASVASADPGAMMDSTSPAARDWADPPEVAKVAEVPAAAKVIVPMLDPFF